jgi:hypothetical protein
MLGTPEQPDAIRHFANAEWEKIPVAGGKNPTEKFEIR